MPSLSEEDDEKSDSETGDLDKQMGDLNGEEADKLDERLWGDDDDEEDEEEDGKTEETGPGMDEVSRRFPHHFVPTMRGGSLPTHCHSLSFFARSLLSWFFFRLYFSVFSCCLDFFYYIQGSKSSLT